VIIWEVRQEKVSGKPRDGRSELATILDFVRAGDTLVVVKLDRLGRSTRDVLNLVHELEEKGAGSLYVSVKGILHYAF
jgi:DNA invertase Pin-like site-specific DNA recombinase